ADVQDATAYRILAIGEASKGFGDDLKSRHPHVPWRQILGMRNLLAHEYFIRESELIWETIRVGLPELADVCRAELGRQENQEDSAMTRAVEILSKLPEDIFADERQDSPPQDRDGLDD
ncbi:MAG TPA: HepT-like ribonuclease domain-containing protein, partial [Alphaproteobacteria bacterium]|nr:HepT-like ribonuclease domain-containing protein [Alphaproteobacteria bacterium]